MQNEVATGRYTLQVSAGHIPLARGLPLTDADRVTGHVIEQLMCNFRLNYDELRRAFGPLAGPVIDRAEEIAASEHEGLCQSDGRNLLIPMEARPLVRAVAARFDRWLNPEGQRYSKVV
ncbi:MAG: hypothetical protein U1E15_05290 [Hyphomicrobiales bacterium]